MQWLHTCARRGTLLLPVGVSCNCCKESEREQEAFERFFLKIQKVDLKLFTELFLERHY
jgi:hypothetical protein